MVFAETVANCMGLSTYVGICLLWYGPIAYAQLPHGGSLIMNLMLMLCETRNKINWCSLIIIHK